MIGEMNQPYSLRKDYGPVLAEEFNSLNPGDAYMCQQT